MGENGYPLVKRTGARLAGRGARVEADERRAEGVLKGHVAGHVAEDEVAPRRDPVGILLEEVDDPVRLLVEQFAPVDRPAPIGGLGGDLR